MFSLNDVGSITNQFGEHVSLRLYDDFYELNRIGTFRCESTKRVLTAYGFYLNLFMERYAQSTYRV